jgi:hypothetical protein
VPQHAGDGALVGPRRDDQVGGERAAEVVRDELDPRSATIALRAGRAFRYAPNIIDARPKIIYMIEGATPCLRQRTFDKGEDLTKTSDFSGLSLGATRS